MQAFTTSTLKILKIIKISRTTTVDEMAILFLIFWLRKCVYHSAMNNRIIQKIITTMTRQSNIRCWIWEFSRSCNDYILLLVLFFIYTNNLTSQSFADFNLWNDLLGFKILWLETRLNALNLVCKNRSSAYTAN